MIVLTIYFGTTIYPLFVYSTPSITLYSALLPLAARHTPFKFWSYSYKIFISYINVEFGVDCMEARVWCDGLVDS